MAKGAPQRAIPPNRCQVPALDQLGPSEACAKVDRAEGLPRSGGLDEENEHGECFAACKAGMLPSGVATWLEEA